ncbi:hypothetical protein GCM10007301_49650 [Azorhizobium oxalatiphilum]|uniref:Uncharacterized protein n=1 Tax=Azorhizobium oxalatiphilum TaxID=980631 RepID=A0A917FJJ4_9HYPH|nr:DUF1467 family protein [Azorhizobium oxalatiphilum]GGF83707.1 hypothetical protein GCM10007301_49650 [Azorhizobium oxalatiphilum]
MGIGSILAIYFIIWWLCLFAVLPFGVRSHAEAGVAPHPGGDPGAPVRLGLIRKMLATTLLAAVVTAGVIFLVRSGVVRLEDLPMPFDAKGY